MKLTNKFIYDKLMAKFKDQKVGYGTWDVEYATKQILDEYANANGYNKNEFRTSKSGTYNWTAVMTYKGITIGHVDIKRAKGKTTYGYFGNSTEYHYKDFDVSLNTSDIEGEILRIDQAIAQRDKEADDKLTQAKGVVEVIGEMIGKSGYELRSYIEYLYKNKYTLTNT